MSRRSKSKDALLSSVAVAPSSEGKDDKDDEIEIETRVGIGHNRPPVAIELDQPSVADAPPRGKRKKKRKRRRKRTTRQRAPRQPDHLRDIATFCDRNGISESYYFALKRAGRGPREIKLGKRILITPEAEAEWRAARERETVAKTSTGTQQEVTA